MFGWPYSCAQFIMLVVILNILQARFQKYVNPELPDVQTEFIKGRGMTDKIVNICWIIEKAREFQETSTFASLTTLKPLTWVDHNILWKIVKEMRISDHLTCLLRNLYADQEATVRNGPVQNWERTVSRLYIVTLCLTYIHHVKSRTGWIRGWNQDCWEEYQQPQICRWNH